MKKKIQRAVLSLYAVAGIQILSLLWQCLWVAKAFAVDQALTYPGLSNITYASSLGPAIFWAACICGAVYKTAPLLSKEVPWAWAAGICIFFVVIPSYAFPASVVGLLSLFDREVREPFIAALDIQL